MERYRLEGRSVLILSVLLCCSVAAFSPRLSAGVPRPVAGAKIAANGRTQAKTDYTDVRVSPSDVSVSPCFYQIAYELANSEDITAPQAEQAIVLLTAAKELGGTAQQIQPLLIKLACEYAERDYSQQVYRWLDEYVSESIDLEVAKKAIRYLLDRLNTREQREKLLQDLLARLGGKNAALDSQLSTLLGLLMAEKADFKAAQSCFIQAYFNNRYNKLAFAKLAELVPQQVGPTLYLEHLRLVLRENPIDIEAALAFALYAQRLQLYEIAAAAYQYIADLFSYLYPGQALPADIYLPWIISNYNTAQNQDKCLQIAEGVRRGGRFDILVEAIAGKAAAKIGHLEEASRIFQAAEGQIENRKSKIENLSTEQFAWFYCFALQDAAKALDWANKAFSTDPNSPKSPAAALLAYALVMNQELEWAKPLIGNFERTQIADLVQAEIALAEGQKDPAIEHLMTAIAKDPGSLAAERAKELLVKLGQEYSPPVDPDSILKVLRNNFGQAVVAEFISPDKIISVQFATDGSEFPYGSELAGTVAIANNSSQPLVISDDGLFKGNIRIDANISGDLNYKIPKLISHKIAPAILAPGPVPGATLPTGGRANNLIISVPLVTGELRRILRSFPQASLDIEFTLYLDPPAQDKLPITNHQLPSAKLVVKRPGVELTRSSLVNSRSSLEARATSHESRVKIAELFVGLLKEQHAMAEHGTLYRYKFAQWMPNFLKSALQVLLEGRGIPAFAGTGLPLRKQGDERRATSDDWQVLVHTQAAMLSLPLDADLMNAVAKNLNHPNWPVRLMAIYLLATSRAGDGTSRQKGAAPDQVGGGFDKVLDWSAKNDSNSLVRDMAVALKLETSH